MIDPDAVRALRRFRMGAVRAEVAKHAALEDALELKPVVGLKEGRGGERDYEPL